MLKESLFLELDRQFGLADIVSGLNASERASLTAGLEEVELVEPEYLFRQHDPSDGLYFLMSGQLRREVLNDSGIPVKSATINHGNPVGEVEAMIGSRRLCSVYATLPSRLVKLPKDALNAVIQSNAKAKSSMTMFIRRHLRHGLLWECLSVVFPTLDSAVEKEITPAVEWVNLKGGEVLYQQGDPSEALFVVLSGCLRETTILANGRPKVVGRVKRGESLGLAEMITDTTRRSTIYAIRDCELAKVKKSSFFELTDKYPTILRVCARRIALRTMQQEDKGSLVRDDKATIALLPAGDSVPTEELARRLRQALAREGTALVATSKWVDSQLGTKAIAQTRTDGVDGIALSTWLSNLDECHRFIIYVADSTPTEWTRRCLRQAEQVLIVGNQGDDPGLSSIERALLRKDSTASIASRALILLHPDGSRAPSGTQKWLDARDVELHHHIRMDKPDDVERVARFIAGTATCLVLGGGGARGFAHVGALKAMGEHGVPIDIIGGTSMGAYIGAEYILGWTEEEMLERTKRLFDVSVYDLTLPVASLVAGKRLANRLVRMFGEVEIADLWLPYFCVSSNISRCRMMVHRTGLLWKAMRASGGLQGVLPPCVHNGDLLVDGALLSNVPADAMKEIIPTGTVIAIDVSPPEDFLETADYGNSISGWRVLWNMVVPRRASLQVPSLGAVMQRSAETASNVRQRFTIEHMTDLYVKMPVQEYGLLAFHRAVEIGKTGYDYANMKFADWRDGEVLRQAS